MNYPFRFAAAGLTAGLLITGTGADAALVNRYSFDDNVAGVANSGETVIDSLGGADGTILGAGAFWTGTGVDLPGGSSATAAYIDLPNGLVSTKTQVTLEAFVTIDGTTTNWGRIFDFGSTTDPNNTAGPGIELFGPGGGGEGRDYILLSAARGTDYNLQRIGFRNADPTAGLGETLFDTGVTTFAGQAIHVAVTIDNTTPGQMVVNYYRDGIQLTTNGVVNYDLAEINDVNNWLGRSNWTGDENLDGTFEEFRIYDTALGRTSILASMEAGPDTVVADSDNDGIPDDYENMFDFLSPDDPTDAAMDEDMDGSSNLREFEEMTNPEVQDSDDDGIFDGPETNTGVFVDANNTGTDPLDDDTDDDTILDGQETNTGIFVDLTNRGTSPFLIDTDGDGLLDRVENGSGIFNGAGDPGTNPNLRDTDGDTIYDGTEIDAGFDPIDGMNTPTPRIPQIEHRWSFNNPPGSANFDRVFFDSIGGANGMVLGDGAVWTGTALDLPGGASATAPYGDLPNGIISGRTELTIEGFITVDSPNGGNWTSYFDFGDGTAGESFGPGGASEGQSYLFVSAAVGGDYNTNQVELRLTDGAAGGNGQPTAVNPAFGQQVHIVVTADNSTPGATIINYWRNGFRRVTDLVAATDLNQINDVNNWLGRSNWTQDANLDGTYDEFRIYSGAMDEVAVQASGFAGPDVAPTVEPFVITAISRDPVTGEVTIAFTALPSAEYAIDYSGDLVLWTEYLTEISSATSPASETFPPPPGSGGNLLFRVRRTN